MCHPHFQARYAGPRMRRSSNQPVNLAEVADLADWVMQLWQPQHRGYVCGSGPCRSW